MKYLYRKVILIRGIIILLLSHTVVFAQAPDTMWTKVYGQPYPHDERAYSIQETSDHGYIIAGRTGTEYYVGDIYLLKTDSLGDSLWTRTYGGNDEDRGHAVFEMADKGYAIAGYTASYGVGECDFYLIRTDSFGDTLWTRIYGGQFDDRCFAAQQTDDNGFILAGRTNSFGAGDYDFYAIKTDSLGDTLWTKTYGGIDKDICAAVQQTDDKGYVFAGGTQSFGVGSYDIYLVKTDSLGDTLWTKTYGGADHEVCGSICQCFDNGYTMTGVTVSYGAGSGDLYCLRTDENGDTLWFRYWGGTAEEQGFSVMQTPDSCFIVAGRDFNDSLPEPNHADVWFLKVDQTGDTLWARRYGIKEGSTYFDEWAQSVQLTSDGGYIIAGKTGGYVTGDLYLIKIAPDTAVGIEEHETIHANWLTIDVSPNPFRKTTDIRYEICNMGCEQQNVILQIYDISGRLVKNFSLPSAYSLVPTSVTWDGRDDVGDILPSGVYFVSMKTARTTITRKVLLLR